MSFNLLLVLELIVFDIKLSQAILMVLTYYVIVLSFPRKFVIIIKVHNSMIVVNRHFFMTRQQVPLGQKLLAILAFPLRESKDPVS